MTDAEAQMLRRENTYLKTRVAELQDDVADLSSQLGRLRQAAEHAAQPRGTAPNPLAGGQS